MEQKASSKNIVNPSKGRPAQIRLYVQLLSHKIKVPKRKFIYVPNAAYSLLAQYHDIQNLLTSAGFGKMYS
jgi:hypothetical protein